MLLRLTPVNELPKKKRIRRHPKTPEPAPVKKSCNEPEGEEG